MDKAVEYDPATMWRQAYLKKQATRTVTGYMCMIDWDYELGNAPDGNKIYPSIEALKKEHSCWEECGIVEVTVSFNKVEDWGK